MAESKEELRRLLKEESEKAGLKLNIQKTKTMVSGPIASWQIDRKKLETVTDFVFFGSKITEIKKCLLLGRKAMTNLDSILKNVHHFADKGPIYQSYSFSSSYVQM